MSRWQSRISLSAMCLMAFAMAVHGAWITPVGLLDSTGANAYSHAAAISADGQWVVGSSRDASGVVQPFVWSASCSMLFLGNPSGLYSYATGVAVRTDGEVIISGNVGGIGRRWSSTTGAWSALPPTSLCKTAESNALALSADGSEAWIVGSETVRGGCGGTIYIQGYRYSFSTNTRTGPTPSFGSKVYLMGVASNGTAAGVAYYPTVGEDRAIFWSGEGWPTVIPCFADKAGQARAISANGQWVVGHVAIDGLAHAFKWGVGDADYEDLGALAAGEQAYALAANGNGQVIGGYSYSAARPTGQEALATIWDAQGVHLLADVLAKEGIDMSGWVALNDVRSISSDGQTICGDGLFDPDGSGPAAAVQMGYVALIPEPRMGLMVGLLPLLLSFRRRRTRGGL